MRRRNGYHIVVSPNFIGEALHDSKYLPPSVIVSKHTNPTQILKKKETDLLEGAILQIATNIERDNHTWHRDIIMNEARSLLMKIGDILI